MIPNFWCSLEVAAVELHLCFVIQGNVWWKRTFLPMVTIVVLRHMKPFNPYQKQKCRSLWGLIPKYCDASPNTDHDLERLLEIYQEDIGPRQGRIKGGRTGAIALGPPLQGSPP